MAGDDDNDAISNEFVSYLPPELVRFVLRDTYSLLIKGFAGTGKTTLSLTILRALKKKSKFFYISTRTSPKQLFQYYPWLEEFAELGKNSGQDQEEQQDTSIFASFEDARLDEPESLFERITNQLMDVKSPVIIIDSWDAVASFMDKEARLNNERVLQTWRERAGAKLIFISEHPDDTTLDFLVDGVVELKQDQYGETHLREMIMRKMRGVRIARQSYFYSLEGTVFRSLPLYIPPPMISNMQKGDAIMETHGEVNARKSPVHFGTGYDILDYSLGGGFPRSGIVLLELDKYVSTIVPIILMGRAISKFLASENAVFFESFDSIEPDVVFHSIVPFLPKDLKHGLFRIYSAARPGLAGGESARYIMTANKTKKDGNQLVSAVATMKRRHQGKALLRVLDLQSLHDRLDSGGQLSGTISELLPSGNRSGDLIVTIGRTTSESAIKHLAEVCDVHLKLAVINGTLFLQCLLPASTTFGVIADVQKGYKLQLQPMV